MTVIFEKIAYYFTFPIVRNAMIVGILVALCSSILGLTLVLKRFSFIGDGLAHVAFGASALAAVMKLTNNMLLVLPATILGAVLLLSKGRNAKVKGDASLAMISVGMLATGYLLLNLFSKSGNISGDVCTTLFGSTLILTLSNTAVAISIILSILVTAVFVMFYNKIFAITFDEDFATATGTSAKLYNLVLAVVIAVIIVLAMNLVGALLVSALVVFPALSAMRVFKSFKAVTICSVIFSVSCTALGILIAVVAGTPVGALIVFVDVVGFGLFSAVGAITKKA